MEPSPVQADFRLLKSRVTIADVLNHYGIAVIQQGKEWRGNCPFCKQERTKKGEQRAFAINQEKQTYYCHAWKKGGDIIKFVADYEGCALKDAGLKVQDWFNYLLLDSLREHTYTEAADPQGNAPPPISPALLPPDNLAPSQPATGADAVPALLQQILLVIGGIRVDVSFIRQYLNDRGYRSSPPC